MLFCAKKNVKKIGQFLGINISRNARLISFNFDMLSSVYVRQKIYEFGRHQLVCSIGDMEGDFMVPVNNKHVCHASFVV